MNNQNSLLIQKETDRQVRGYEIYKAGLVTKLNESEYLVKDQYIVEDLDKTLLNYDGYTCTCPDYQYNSGLNCKHIIAVTFYQLGL